MRPVGPRNQALDSPPPPNQQIARRKLILDWWHGNQNASLPKPFQVAIGPIYAIELFKLDGRKIKLSGGLQKEERPCWLIFEEDGSDKLVFVYEADRTTLINAFYFVRAGKILEAPEPLELSACQLGNQRATAITAWCSGKGEIVGPSSGNIINSKVSLGRAGTGKVLSGNLGKKRRPCWLTFEEDGKDKIVNVFEADQETLINTFYLVRNGATLKRPEPVVKSQRQSSLEKSQPLLEWLKGHNSKPASYEHYITPNGRVTLCSFDSTIISLIGGLKGVKRPCWLTFEEDGKDKIVNVFEIDRTTKLNSFYLQINGEVLLTPLPVTMSDQQTALKRSQAIDEWWEGKSNVVPEAFEGTINGGSVRLATHQNKQRKLGGNLGPEKKPCWLSFEEDGRDKIVHVFEADRKTRINSFYLVKIGQVLSTPEPLQKSSLQLAQERSKTIREWWTGQGTLPQSFTSTISPEGRVHLTSMKNKPQEINKGLRCKERPCWLSFEERDRDKIIHVFESNQTTLVNSFYLVKNGKSLDLPEPFVKTNGLSAKQKLLAAIGRGDYDKKETAAAYRRELLGMAPYWVTHARHSLLIGLQQEGQLPQFHRELSLGAGTSTSFLVWKNLTQDIQVIDIDHSREMLKYGDNPQKIQASMSEPLPFAPGSFDLVTIDSAFRYVDSPSRAKAIFEAGRVLKKDGILSITELGYAFDQSFIASLEEFGFKVLTPADFRMRLSDSFQQELNRIFLPEVAKTIRRFLEDCGTMIAIKASESLSTLEPLPQLELLRLKDNWEKGNGEEGRFFIPENDFNLGMFDNLLRLILELDTATLVARTTAKSEPTPAPEPAPQPTIVHQESPARTRTRIRLETQLRNQVRDGVVREKIIAVVLAFSENGSFLEIAKDTQKLITFNDKIAALNYRLTYDRRRSIAALTQITN